MLFQASKNVSHFPKFLVGWQIRQERISKGYSIELLATVIQVTPFTLKSYEEGRRRIPLMHLLQIQKFLSIDLKRLIPASLLESNVKTADEDSFPIGDIDHIFLILFLAKNNDLLLKEQILNIVHRIRLAKPSQHSTSHVGTMASDDA